MCQLSSWITAASRLRMICNPAQAQVVQRVRESRVTCSSGSTRTDEVIALPRTKANIDRGACSLPLNEPSDVSLSTPVRRPTTAGLRTPSLDTSGSLHRERLYRAIHNCRCSLREPWSTSNVLPFVGCAQVDKTREIAVGLWTAPKTSDIGSGYCRASPCTPASRQNVHRHPGMPGLRFASWADCGVLPVCRQYRSQMAALIRANTCFKNQTGCTDPTGRHENV